MDWGVSCVGVTEFVTLNKIDKWLNVAHHFTLQEINTDDIEMVFLNQIRGIQIGNNLIYKNTRSDHNGGI